MLNPASCGPELTGIQTVKLMSNVHFSPYKEMLSLNLWNCATKNGSFMKPCRKTVALDFCLYVEQGKWLSAGQGLSKGVVWCLLSLSQCHGCCRAAPEASKLQVVVLAHDQSKQEHCSPVICNCLWFCFCSPSAQWVTRNVSLSWRTTKKKRFQLSASCQHSSQSGLV